MFNNNESYFFKIKGSGVDTHARHTQTGLGSPRLITFIILFEFIKRN